MNTSNMRIGVKLKPSFFFIRARGLSWIFWFDWFACCSWSFSPYWEKGLRFRWGMSLSVSVCAEEAFSWVELISRGSGVSNLKSGWRSTEFVSTLPWVGTDEVGVIPKQGNCRTFWKLKPKICKVFKSAWEICWKVWIGELILNSCKSSEKFFSKNWIFTSWLKIFSHKASNSSELGDFYSIKYCVFIMWKRK